MSGPSIAEFLILCLIGLIVLGPKRLPEVASQLGKWVGQARRMTRVMRRQLEEEIDLEKQLDIKPVIHSTPRDDDTYSPLHDTPPSAAANVSTDSSDTPDDGDSAQPPDEESGAQADDEPGSEPETEDQDGERKDA